MPRPKSLRHKGAAQKPGAPSAQDKYRALGVAGSNVPATVGRMADLKIEPMLGLYPDDIDVPDREVRPKLPTRIKIKLRERMILGLTALLAVAAGLAPLATMARGGLVTFIVFAGLMIALGRVPGTGAPFEAYFVVRINFWLRSRFYVKGGTSTRKEYQFKLDPESWGSWRWNVRALPLSWWGWLGVLLIVFAAVIITGL